MRHVPVAKFKDQASALVAAAEAGEEIAVTRHGRVAARLVPPVSAETKPSFDELWDKLMQQRERMRAEGRTATMAELTAWKNEGRR